MSDYIQQLDQISLSLGQIFKDAAQRAEKEGYPHLVILPRAELTMQGSKLVLAVPLAEKNEVSVGAISADFQMIDGGLRVRSFHGNARSGDDMEIRFVAFKTVEEQKALVDAIKGMEFFNQERIYAVAYDVDKFAASKGESYLARSSFQHNLRAHALS